MPNPTRDNDDPRPAFAVYRTQTTDTLGRLAKVTACAHRSAEGECARYRAEINVEATSGAASISLPGMNAREARALAALLLRAADDADAIDAWHDRQAQDGPEDGCDDALSTRHYPSVEDSAP